jgi:hypothetical protein
MVKKSSKTGTKCSSFLLSLPRRFCKETDLEWPQPDKIHLVPNDENIAFLFPKENLKELGYELFKKTASLVMPLIIEETWVPN